MAHLKGYGLFVPKNKAKATPVQDASKLQSVFGDDDSSEDEAPDDRARANYALQRAREAAKRKEQAQAKKLEAEDPNVFAYDEVYDDIEKQRSTNDPTQRGAASAKPQRKQAQYFHMIQKRAKEREIERQIIEERQAQREREREGEEFADKEAFVTAAFRKKMEELKKKDEELQREEARELAQDVTKRGDLSGFYSSLLTDNVAMGGAKTDKAEDTKPDKPSEGKSGGGGDGHRGREGREADNRAPPRRSRFSHLQAQGDDAGASAVPDRRRSPEAHRSRRSRSRSRSPPRRSRSPPRRKPEAAANTTTEQKEQAKQQEEEDMAAKFKRRTEGQALSAARERALARKKARGKRRPLEMAEGP